MPEEPPICGKPVTSFPLGNDDRVGLPVYPGGGGITVSVHTICLLPPDHVGPCMDAKVMYRDPDGRLHTGVDNN